MEPKKRLSVSCHSVPGGYVLDADIRYHSPRFNKDCTVKAGFFSDGVSGPDADILSESWWVHDMLRRTGQWDDFSPCSAWQASWVLHDILKSEGRWFRAVTWGVFTFAACWVKDLF